MKRYIHITAGAQEEACFFVVAQVLKKMIKVLRHHGAYFEVIQRERADLPGNLKSAALWFLDKEDSGLLNDWLGTIQWVSESPFQSQVKRTNWFVCVHELPRDNFDGINLTEIKFEAMRSQGPGGQNVNKVNSAVRAIHLPTGIAVKVMDTRSQVQNKKIAEERLKKLLEDEMVNQLKNKLAAEWQNQLFVQKGRPVKSFNEKDFKIPKETKKFKNERSREKQKWKNEFKYLEN